MKSTVTYRNIQIWNELSDDTRLCENKQTIEITLQNNLESFEWISIDEDLNIDEHCLQPVIWYVIGQGLDWVETNFLVIPLL